MNEYDKLLWEIHFKRMHRGGWGDFELIDMGQLAESLKAQMAQIEKNKAEDSEERKSGRVRCESSEQSVCVLSFV